MYFDGHAGWQNARFMRVKDWREVKY